MWNDTDEPLAFLITFRTYGTWLHGDERGSTDRHNNRYGTPFICANDKWRNESKARMKRTPVKLDENQRPIVEKAILEVCRTRGWSLYAVNARTNHVHSVVANGGVDPDVVLGLFKSYATRRMREGGCWNQKSSPWSDKGSKRRLWNERSIADAVDYVLNRQGSDLPRHE